MSVKTRSILRLSAVVGLTAIATAFTRSTTPPPVAAGASAPVPGATFRIKVTLRHSPSAGRTRRPITLLGHGQFAAGKGRLDIDSLDAPSSFRKGDIFIIQDTVTWFWARPSDLRVRKMNSPLQNPLEGISERFSSSTGTPSRLRVEFDTVSLSETLNGQQTRHFRITADAVYPVGTQQVQQKVVIETWLAKTSMTIVNPFGPRIRGLPELPATTGYYRAFLNTLAAANRVFGNDVAVKTTTTTSYIYAPGLGEDYLQTVELLDLQLGQVDEKLFQLSGDYKMATRASDTVGMTRVIPPVKPPTR